MNKLNGTQFYLIELTDKHDNYLHYTVCNLSEALKLMVNVNEDYIVSCVDLLPGSYRVDYREFMKKENK